MKTLDKFEIKDLLSVPVNLHSMPANSIYAQPIQIDWNYLIEDRRKVLDTIEGMPKYLLYPEVKNLLDAEFDLRYQLIFSIMWVTGARISEVLALTRERLIRIHQGFYFNLDTLKKRGRPTITAKSRRLKRYVPLLEEQVINDWYRYIQTFGIRAGQRLFPMTRQSVHIHLKKTLARAGEMDISVSCHTFRHSFAIHMLLHGIRLKYLSRLLGHASIQSTEIYTNVLTIDGRHFFKGVNFF